jgi:hypothetical protein
MSIVVCQEKNTYLHYFIFPLNFPGLLKSEGGQEFRKPIEDVLARKPPIGTKLLWIPEGGEPPPSFPLPPRWDPTDGGSLERDSIRGPWANHTGGPLKGRVFPLTLTSDGAIHIM